jgi:hypothetical protein
MDIHLKISEKQLPNQLIERAKEEKAQNNLNQQNRHIHLICHKLKRKPRISWI